MSVSLCSVSVLSACMYVCLDLTNNSGARVILAGDHRQLGPIIRSAVALRHVRLTFFFEFFLCGCERVSLCALVFKVCKALDRSLMERLCDTVKVYEPNASGAEILSKSPSVC